jgi:hypothetical protein
MIPLRMMVGLCLITSPWGMLLVYLTCSLLAFETTAICKTGLWLTRRVGITVVEVETVSVELCGGKVVALYIILQRS